jgi:hypothetical protein
MKHIETKKGLKELLRRYEEAGADEYWLMTIRGCIEEDLAMDEIDYENTPKELRKLWRGLK